MNATVKRHKEATSFIYVSKVWWREGVREEEGGGSGPYHSIRPVDIIPSSRINSPRRREMRKERVRGEEEGGLWVRGAEMVVVSICQRNTALRVLLKRPHKPELSLVGGWHADVQATRSSATDLSARLGHTCSP